MSISGVGPGPGEVGGDAGGAAAAPAGSAAPPPLASAGLGGEAELREVAAGRRTLGFGARGPAVAAVRGALAELGHGDGKGDPVLDRGVERALSVFQREAGVAPSGAVDAATLAALDAKLASHEARPRGAARMLTEETGGIAGRDEDFAALADWTGKAANVTIAVVDFGVDTSAHPVFADNRFANPGETPGDGIDNDGNRLVDDASGWSFADGAPRPIAPTEFGGHGVSVAGLAAYGTDKLKVLPLAISVDSAATPADSEIAQAVDYARSMGARVVNCSFIVGSEVELHALSAAIDRNPDLLFLQGAGNDATDIDKTPEMGPGLRKENMLVVANANTWGPKTNMYRESNWGATSVDLGAPGTQVRAPAIAEDRGAAPGADGGLYHYQSGTSFAAPFVSNVGAKLFSLCPGLTALEAKRVILETVDPAREFAGQVATGGVINSLRAYRCAAVLAKATSPAQLDAAVAALPGGIPAAEREMIKRTAEAVLAGRTR